MAHTNLLLKGVLLCLALTSSAGAAAPPKTETPPPETSAVPIPPAQIEQAIAALDDIIESVQQRTQVPGLAVAVVRDGMTVYAKGVGVRSTESELPVTADTVFQLASVSKSVGATVVAHQVGKSRITWDTPYSNICLGSG